jgi:hypothetical protein
MAANSAAPAAKTQEIKSAEAPAKVFYVTAKERDFALRVAKDTDPKAKDGKLRFRVGEVVEVPERLMVHLEGYSGTWLEISETKPGVEQAAAIAKAKSEETKK